MDPEASNNAHPLKGSKNRATNGSRINAKRLVLGQLPREMISAQRESRAYRRALEAAVRDTHGKITPQQAHIIGVATQHDLHVGICRYLLRSKIGQMAPTDILACSREMALARRRQEKAVRQLELDRQLTDKIAELYRTEEV